MGGIPFTSSDSLGLFKLNNLCVGQTILTISRPGFIEEKREFVLISDTTINFSIRFDPSFFKTVEISDQREQDIPSGISGTITPHEMERLRGNLLADITKTLPGVNALQSGSNISKPIIHGLHSNRILILTNGVRLEGQQWGTDHGPEFDPFVAKKITVVKGAGTLRYGSDAIGGVIISEPDALRTSAGLDGAINIVGATNGRSGIVSGKIRGKSTRIKGLSLGMQGTLKKGGNIRTPNYFLKNTGVEETNFSANGDYNHNKWNLSAYVSKFKTEIGIFSGSHIGNITDLLRAIESKQPSETSDFTYEINRPYQAVEHDLSKYEVSYFPNKNNRLKILYSRQYNQRAEFDKHRPRNDSLASLNEPELLMKLTTHQSEISWIRNPNKKWSSEWVLNGINQANTYRGRYFIPNYRLQGIGFYGRQKYNSANYSLEASVRYDLRELNVFRATDGEQNLSNHKYSGLSAAITSTHVLNEFWNFAINGASAWRIPTANELYSDGLHHGAASIEKGDPQLVPERLWSLQTNLNFKKNNLILDVSPYFNYITDFIFAEPQRIPVVTIRGTFPLHQFSQTDAVITGSDFALTLNASEKIRLTGRASLLRAFNRKLGDYQIMMPSDSYFIQADYFARDYKKLTNNTLTISGQFANKQWRVPANSDLTGPPSAYFLIDIAASTLVKIKKQSATISLTVSNLLNQTYRNYLNRFRYFTDEQGRNITLRISIPFNINT